MTTELFKVYLDKVIKKRVGGIFSPQTLVLLDQATSHKVADVEMIPNCNGLLLPAGCTSLVQPLDVVINKPFKSYMRRQWKAWFEVPEEQQELTKKGNRKRVS